MLLEPRVRWKTSSCLDASFHAETEHVPSTPVTSKAEQEEGSADYCSNLARPLQALNALHLGCPAWIAWPAGTLRPGFCLSRGRRIHLCKCPSFCHAHICFPVWLSPFPLSTLPASRARQDVSVVPSCHRSAEDLGQEAGIQLQLGDTRHGVEHCNSTQSQWNVHLSGELTRTLNTSHSCGLIEQVNPSARFTPQEHAQTRCTVSNGHAPVSCTTRGTCNAILKSVLHPVRPAYPAIPTKAPWSVRESET